MIPRSPSNRGSVRESHLTFAQVLDALLPQMKFLTTPLIWLHILGLGFQQAAMYHMEESRTWLVTKILLVRERLQLPHAIILPLREVMSLSKLPSRGAKSQLEFPSNEFLHSHEFTLAPPPTPIPNLSCLDWPKWRWISPNLVLPLM